MSGLAQPASALLPAACLQQAGRQVGATVESEEKSTHPRVHLPALGSEVKIELAHCGKCANDETERPFDSLAREP
ncbi:hypothetical protein Nhal_0913 [Nitrosococcus halophilus Nc 4]|uniref:Uncharacterized protein n=1 Tax=Nitrosococcus halophilus (strain Nc4) TaxID=472759 RepID=D5BYA4_NITHN|nr:hypothetical protein Nhal_0913 [Nitrosococcus halophilus Nc 4]